MSYTNGLDNPELYFQTKLFTGNGGTQSITLDGSENMQPDWCWFKNRTDAGNNHLLYDSVRGATKRIQSSTANAEATDSGGLTSFDSDGFSVGDKGSLNNSSSNIVCWNWKAGTTISSTSTSGSGTAKTYTGSVSTIAGFSIIRYVGNGTAGHTIPHHLGAKPDAILVKHLGDGQQWATQWSPLGATKVMRWATSNSVSDSNTRWNDTEPTTSVFTLGNEAEVNTNDGNHIAYCFTNIKSYSKIGSYIGNGDANNGAFIFLGFRPAFVMVKQTNASGENWFICDNKREGYNAENNRLLPDTNDSESTDSPIDILSNGFKARQSGAAVNGSGSEYIYMAFAESPFVNSKGVPTNAR